MTDNAPFQIGGEFYKLPVRLGSILEEVFTVFQDEKDSSLRVEIYKSIEEKLRVYNDGIQETLNLLSSNIAPEGFEEAFLELDEIYTRSADAYLDAIECMREFIEIENGELLDEAKDALDEGNDLLNEAEEKSVELKSLMNL